MQNRAGRTVPNILEATLEIQHLATFKDKIWNLQHSMIAIRPTASLPTFRLDLKFKNQVKSGIPKLLNYPYPKIKFINFQYYLSTVKSTAIKSVPKLDSNERPSLKVSTFCVNLRMLHLIQLSISLNRMSDLRWSFQRLDLIQDILYQTAKTCGDPICR